MSLRLQDALEALYGLERRRDKHDLEGTIALLRALGDPHLKFRSVHVAGTNGKGSVCALVERVLREAGYRTGLYTSPHLVDFRERIRVSGLWADEAWLERKLAHIESLPEGKDRTFFEVATALAFEYFAEQQVEIAVVEVGLGGRLDCTNVITPVNPYLIIILAVLRRYMPSAGLGTIIALMLPYCLAILVAWTALLQLWIWLDVPLGPAGPLHYLRP